jgi:hypothetical protein
MGTSSLVPTSKPSLQWYLHRHSSERSTLRWLWKSCKPPSTQLQKVVILTARQCKSGSICANGVCTASACTGKTCSTYTACGPGGTCVCGTTTAGKGFCVDGETPCQGLADCKEDMDCLGGQVCIEQSCCQRKVCVGPSFCGGASTSKRWAIGLEARSWVNGTIARPAVWVD